MSYPNDGNAATLRFGLYDREQGRRVFLSPEHKAEYAIISEGRIALVPYSAKKRGDSPLPVDMDRFKVNRCSGFWDIDHIGMLFQDDVVAYKQHAYVVDIQHGQWQFIALKAGKKAVPMFGAADQCLLIGTIYRSEAADLIKLARKVLICPTDDPSEFSQPYYVEDRPAEIGNLTHR